MNYSLKPLTKLTGNDIIANFVNKLTNNSGVHDIGGFNYENKKVVAFIVALTLTTGACSQPVFAEEAAKTETALTETAEPENTAVNEETSGTVCVHINGVVNIEYDQTKSFDWYIDEETGLTVRFIGYDSDGSIGRFIEVKNLKFNDEAEPVQTPDFTGMTDGNYYAPEFPEGYEVAGDSPAIEIPTDTN